MSASSYTSSSKMLRLLRKHYHIETPTDIEYKYLRIDLFINKLPAMTFYRKNLDLLIDVVYLTERNVHENMVLDAFHMDSIHEFFVLVTSKDTWVCETREIRQEAEYMTRVLIKNWLESKFTSYRTSYGEVKIVTEYKTRKTKIVFYANLNKFRRSKVVKG